MNRTARVVGALALWAGSAIACTAAPIASTTSAPSSDVRATTTPPPSAAPPGSVPVPVPVPVEVPRGERVTFSSGDLELEGYVFRPPGPGPFPAVVWNHGSEKDPTSGQFDAIAKVFVPAGFVVFAPVRRGQGASPGEYVVDQIAAAGASGGLEAANALQVQLLTGPQLDDQLAGLRWLADQPYVDASTVAVAGCSFGGIETLLGAERAGGSGYRAAIAISPAAETWALNATLRTRLLAAADAMPVPILIIQPQHDADVSPGYELGRAMQAKGKPYGLEIIPPFGTERQQRHCFGGQGGEIWGPNAVHFLRQALDLPAA